MLSKGLRAYWKRLLKALRASRGPLKGLLRTKRHLGDGVQGHELAESEDRAG